MSAPTPRRVAVIVVTYRTAALSIDCLRSLEGERQDPSIWLHVFVVDNASGDAVLIEEAVRREAWGDWVTVLRAPRNGGFAYGNNIGIRAASAAVRPHYFHLLNPDTRVTRRAIAELVEFLEARCDVGIAGSSFENDDGTEWPIAFRFPSLASEIESGLQMGIISHVLQPWSVVRRMEGKPQQIDWGAGASMMVRRELVDRIGGLDENYFLYFEETEFCWRARRAGYPMWYVPPSRVIHIGGQSTKVTERNVALRRLPDYWFESRRRYFMSTKGIVGAAVIDAAALIATALGTLRLWLQGRRDRIVPNLVRDLWRHSAMRKANRHFERPRTHVEVGP